VKTVRVRYFAILREQRGIDEESVATTAATAATGSRFRPRGSGSP
jgi:molybdopterin converting factor small subunit